MGSDKKLDLTIEEGQSLLMLASHFNLPEKLGAEQVYTIADRAIACDEVRKLYREMRSRSPLLQRKERWHRFGPADMWVEFKTGDEQTGHRCLDNGKIVQISLDEEISSGIVWCLLVALHPASEAVAIVSKQEDIFWPIAVKLKKLKIIRETIGMSKETARPVRWKSDDEYDDDQNTSSPGGTLSTKKE